jgi:cyanophycinase
MKTLNLTFFLIYFFGLGDITAQSLGRVGLADITTTPTAGTVLMGGGTDVNGAFKWMINKSGGGDFVVIRATGTNGYNSYIYNMGGANSVETFLINSTAKANDSSIVQAVRKAEAIFFAGGDQGQYVTYCKGTALGKVINYLANVKHAPIGGTSAGMAIMSNVYYSAIITSVDSPAALANPYCTFDDVMYDDFLSNPFLINTITDTHFLTRGRQGRTMSFLARMIKDKGRTDVKAIACDEATAVCIDENGIAMVVGSSKAHFIRQWCAGPETCEPEKALDWTTGVQVYVVTGIGRYSLPSTSQSVDLKNWTTVAGGAYEYWTVNNGAITLGQATSTPTTCGPTVMISRTEAVVAENGKFNLTFKFSEDVAGFDISDISATNCTTSNFVVLNAKVYTVDITSSSSQEMIISVAANKAINGSGVSNMASNNFFVYTPTIKISRTSGSGTVTAKFNVIIKFSEDVTGFDASDISVSKGTIDNFVATNAQLYKVDVTPTETDTIAISVTANKVVGAYGISNAASNIFKVASDITPPTVTIIGTSGSGVVNGKFSVTFTFSEFIFGFSIADITVTNGLASNFVSVEPSKVYTADITPSVAGDVIINVAGGVLQDFAGNLNLAANPLTIEYFTTAIEILNGHCIKVFPNPNNGTFKVEVSNVQNQLIKIFDLLGRLVYCSVIKSSFTKVGLNYLPKGIYIIQIIDGGKEYSEKLIIN